MKQSTVRLGKLGAIMPYMLIIVGIIGLICSFIISLDKIKILENPSFQPGCNLNPIISCGSVMRSAQGSVFGFPNPWMGLVGFGILVTVGMSLLAGAKYKRWFWLGLQAGVTAGLIFAYWLLFESVYRIHALCPYCLTTDVIVITLSWYLTLYNLQTGVIKLPRKSVWQRLQTFAQNHHLDLLILWFLILCSIVINHFWYYFGSHLF